MTRHALAALAVFAAGGVAAQGHPYVLDLTHTFATVELPGPIATVQARFDRKAGTLQLDRAARTGRVEVTVEAATVNTGSATLDAQLRSWLDTATHPQARFVGEQFRFDGDRVAAVSGTLTVAGRSTPLTLTAQRFNCYTSPLLQREVCGGDFVAELDRGAFGITFGRPFVGDRVRLLIQVEAIRQ